IKREMIRLNINLLGISELHWKDNGHFKLDDVSVYYSGHQELRRNGVALIAHKNIAHAVKSYTTISDCIMAIRICGNPLNVMVLQVYVPTTDAPEDESERFYAKIEEALEQVPKKDIIYIMGDFNAKVGSQEEANIIGRCGLGERKEAGDGLVQFCHENHLRVSNTWFMQPKCRLYTWTAPNGQRCNQIDYILCSQCWKSHKTFPGADCGSDHELLVATIKVKFCNIKKNAPSKRFDVSKVPVSYAVTVRNRFELLGNEDKQLDELWQEFQSTIIKTTQEHIPYKKLEKRTETIKIADQRRTAEATGDQDEAWRLNTEFQRAARKDKEAYWEQRCKQMEEECRKGHTRNLFAQVKKIRTSFTTHKGAIKNKKAMHQKQMAEYTEELYASTSDLEPPHDDPVEMEPAFLDEEVVWALKKLPNNKAPGIDCIPAEMLRPVPPVAIKAICQKIWETNSRPKDWKRSVFISLPKKDDARDCCSYRTITLIPHASKVLLKIIQQGLCPIIEAELPDSQAVFKRGCGTSDHITNLRWIMEKCHEHQKNIIEHDKLWKALQELGVPAHLIQLIRDQEATVRTQHGDTEWFKIEKGVQQGYILSPFLFNLYSEMIMRKLDLEESEIGVKIGGRNINNLCYADDTTLLAETEDGLEYLILRIKKESEKMGLHLNIKNTKIMTTAGKGAVKITINSEEIKCVKGFCFLGSIFDQTGDCGPEIRRRIELGRSAIMSMHQIWKSKDISFTTKCKMVHAIVFPTSMYGCESWTLKKADRKRMDPFELWCWRRLLRIPWTARVSNKEVLEHIKPEISLAGKVTRLQFTYFGQVMR
uniref:Reverse transcriptase domain-containing protein n=1 Tax=Lepisosteus oculatus TaxID=7918 RepID=W5NGM3_LEPOC